MCARVLALEQNYDDTIDRPTDNDSLTTRERSMRVLGMRTTASTFCHDHACEVLPMP